MIVSPTTFSAYNEFHFLEFLVEESYLKLEDFEYVENTDADLTEFETQFRYIAWMLESRRDHDIVDTNPYFRAIFRWVIATEGPDKRITGVSLIRTPDKIDAIGDIIYLEGKPNATPEALQELHDEAQKVAGTWYEERLPHYNIKTWKDMLNVQFMHLIRQGTLK